MPEMMYITEGRRYAMCAARMTEAARCIPRQAFLLPCLSPPYTATLPPDPDKARYARLALITGVYVPAADAPPYHKKYQSFFFFLLFSFFSCRPYSCNFFIFSVLELSVRVRSVPRLCICPLAAGSGRQSFCHIHPQVPQSDLLSLIPV